MEKTDKRFIYNDLLERNKRMNRLYLPTSFLLLSLLLMNGGQETVGIIGGADMPTLWFLLGRLGILPDLFWACAIVLFAAAAVCGARSKR